MEVLLREKETMLKLKKLSSTRTGQIQRAYKYKDV